MRQFDLDSRNLSRLSTLPSIHIDRSDRRMRVHCHCRLDMHRIESRRTQLNSIVLISMILSVIDSRPVGGALLLRAA